MAFQPQKSYLATEYKKKIMCSVLFGKIKTAKK
jgi:hypothetical protein